MEKRAVFTAVWPRPTAAIVVSAIIEGLWAEERLEVETVSRWRLILRLLQRSTMAILLLLFLPLLRSSRHTKLSGLLLWRSPQSAAVTPPDPTASPSGPPPLARTGVAGQHRWGTTEGRAQGSGCLCHRGTRPYRKS